MLTIHVSGSVHTYFVRVSIEPLLPDGKIDLADYLIIESNTEFKKKYCHKT